MKHLRLFLAIGLVALSLSSCKTVQTYTYYQVLETMPDKTTAQMKNDNSAQKYESADCDIYYYFWGESGNSTFLICNKTDKLISVDLSKSFFIKNGTAYNLYNAMTFINTSSASVSTQSTLSYGNMDADVFYNSASRAGLLNENIFASKKSTTNISGYATKHTLTNQSTLSTNNGTMIPEEKIVVIPPHSNKTIVSYPICSNLYQDCDMALYPSTKSSKTFTENNTPLHFSYYLTYTKGTDTTQHALMNGFFISSVSNYPEPELVCFEKRAAVCDNLKEPGKEYYEDVYDKKIKQGLAVPSKSFYNVKTVKSKKELFKKNPTKYYYQSSVNGYTTTDALESGNLADSSNKGTLAVAITLILAIPVAVILL